MTTEQKSLEFPAEEAVKFGRWLLKNCEPEFDGQYLTWRCNALFTSDTTEAYQLFKAENP